jgi:uracil-DNA glycosylase
MRPTDLIHESWSEIRYLLNEEELVKLRTEILPNIIFYPRIQDMFKVFSMPVQDIKVVILGQDPYHGPDQATGLCFAVQPQNKMPPSLRIIQKELQRSAELYPEMFEQFNQNKDELWWKTLVHWREQGVFLLNTALTVESAKPGSHLAYWQRFTQQVISFIGRKNPCIWFLWGAKAQAFIPHIGQQVQVKGYDLETIKEIPLYAETNYVFTSAHPAAETYSNNAGYIGNNHFIFANEILKRSKKTFINF